MNNQYMIPGLKKYLNFIKLIMKKNIRVNIYTNTKNALDSHSMFLFGMLKPSIKLKIYEKQGYDSILDCNIELNHYESDSNKVEFDSSELFTKKIARFNFYCTSDMMYKLTINIVEPFGKQFKMSVEEYEKTHKCESGHMLQPPQHDDPNYKENMKLYWKTMADLNTPS